VTNAVDAALTLPLGAAMRTPQALRRLRPDPVDEALVLRLIELALTAPTARHAQPCACIVVKGRALKARLARAYRTAWGLYGRLGQRLTAGNANSTRSSGRWGTSRTSRCWWSPACADSGRCGRHCW